MQNTEEEGESNPPLIADSINSFYCFCFNPLALWALPLYSLTETQGERGLTLLLPLLVFLIPLLVATLLSSPLYFALQNAGEEGNTSFRNEVGYRSFFFAVL